MLLPKEYIKKFCLESPTVRKDLIRASKDSTIADLCFLCPGNNKNLGVFQAFRHFGVSFHFIYNIIILYNYS